MALKFYANIIGNKLTVTADATNIVPLISKGFASQTANLQEWQNDAGTVLSRINSVGAALVPYVRDTNGNGPYLSMGSAQISVRPASNNKKGLVFLGEVGQYFNLAEYQDSAATINGGRNAVGHLWAGSTTPVNSTNTTALTSAAYTSATVAVFTYGGTSLVQVGQQVTVAGVTGGAYNGTWTVTAVTSTTFTVLGSGFTNVAGTGGTFTLNAVASFTAPTAAITPMVIKAAASQTADLAQWQNSAGTVLQAVTGEGVFPNYIVSTSVSTSYTPVLSDAGKNIELNLTATGTASIPLNSSVAYPVGTQLTFIQTGTGTVKITTASTGTTLNHYSAANGATTAAATLKGQWAAATAIKRATDTWILIGNLT